ncbi:MAG: methylmalonyl Co-A mutase-associated GTPase MeaB [Rikenellaceae bacterium]
MKHFEDDHHHNFENSALHVQGGVEQPPVVNPYFKRKRRRELSVDEYVEGILSGSIVVLGQAITLIESSLPEHKVMAQAIIERCIPYSGKSIRVGITGVPGAGKSTFIEAIGGKVVSEGRKLAVLAIDPSSQRSRGSILGDKTRMESLAHEPNVFIRPSPSGNSLGGVARKTRETMVVCEAAGFDTIFIETVGVGQSETAVHSMVDIFLMLQISGAGDELQGIKRGIMEMSDMIAITKADGSNIDKANLTKVQIKNALQLFPMPESGLRPQVFTISSTEGYGLEELWAAIMEYLQTTQNFEGNRSRQSTYWMEETINEALLTGFYGSSDIKSALAAMRQRVINNELSPFQAAAQLLQRHEIND